MVATNIDHKCNIWFVNLRNADTIQLAILLLRYFYETLPWICPSFKAFVPGATQLLSNLYTVGYFIIYIEHVCNMCRCYVKFLHLCVSISIPCLIYSDIQNFYFEWWKLMMIGRAKRAVCFSYVKSYLSMNEGHQTNKVLVCTSGAKNLNHRSLCNK